MPSVTGANKIKPIKKPCDWKDCPGGLHPVMPKYESRKKGGNEQQRIQSSIYPCTYRVQWKENPYRTLNYPRPNSTKPPKVKTNFNYRYQRHHVIPCNMLDTYPDLFWNAMLVGWDHNDYETNGINLPWHDLDVVWNDLQAHFGSHPRYDGQVDKYMSKLDGKCRSFCENEETKSGPTTVTLLALLEEQVDMFREKIINWDTAYTLNNNAIANRSTVFKLYSDKKRIPRHPDRKSPI
jgi:hypothetical protein